MKRSKVLNIIADMFYECNLDPEDADKKAEELLTKLEEAGMLPPSYTLFPNRKVGAGGAVAATRIDGRWEPEDEQG